MTYYGAPKTPDFPSDWPFNLTLDMAEQDFDDQVMRRRGPHTYGWPGYRRIAIKRHERGLILLADIYGGGECSHFSTYINDDRQDVPYWHTIEHDRVDRWLELPDLGRPNLPEPEFDLEEIHHAKMLMEEKQ